MAKLFAVVVATVPEYYEYKKEHPEHDRLGSLLGSANSRNVIQTENLEQARAIVNSSPRVRDGMLA